MALHLLSSTYIQYVQFAVQLFQPGPKSPFVYDQLPSNRHIRLLRIDRGATEQISVFLKAFTLDSLPVEYQALSYT